MNKKRLKELVEKRARQYGEFTLVSGQPATHYFDAKQVLCDPEGVYLIGKGIYELLVWRILGFVIRRKVAAIGGEGIGGRAIVSAVVAYSYLKRKPICGFEVVRREELRKDDPQRGEGAEYVIKGHLPPPGSKVAIFDDVLTTGGSILKAIKAAEDRGCRAAIVGGILDRQQGGSAELRRRGYRVKSFLRADSTGNVYIN